MNAQKLSVAVVQMCSTDQYENNLSKIKTSVERAVKKNPQLICFPENALYLRAEGETITWNTSIERYLVQEVSTLAASHRVHLLIGSMPTSIAGSKKIYNTSIVFGPNGKQFARYRKIHLFDVTLPDGRMLFESKNVEPGEKLVTKKIEGWNFGFSICYDVRYPELYRKLRKKGTEALLVPAAFTVPTGRVHWETLLRARAIENQCYLLAPAQTGVHSLMRESYGHSLIIDPWGEIIASADMKETILYATLEKEVLNNVRQRMPCWENRRLDV